jgi:predicted nucleic acid-binding protein
MTALIDSGFLYATVDQGDRNHQRVVKLFPNLPDNLLLPITVLVEVAYLLQARLGHPAMRHFIQQLEHSPIQIEPINKTDLTRIYALLDQYADAELDFVDASIVAIAERLNIRRILTVDRRDFSLIRPTHCDYFEILP